MDPVTVREWELLVKAIDELKDMVESRFDGLHTDISSQKNKITALEVNHLTITQELKALKDGRRWRWEAVLLPIILIVLAFMLPHIQWRP